MKKYLFGAVAVLAVLVGSNIQSVSAGIEDRIYSLLQGVSSAVDLARREIYTNTYTEGARFDAIETKLDRLYESCGRSTTPTRRVTLAQINTCVNNCFTNSLVGPADQGSLHPERLTSCIARCPSNTLRNIECAQGYARITGTAAQINGEYVNVVQNAAAFTRRCAESLRPGNEAICRVYADLFASNLNACLFDQTAHACQADCTRNYQNEGAFIFCHLRCQSRTRATANFERLQAGGLINEDGSLAIDALSNTTINLPAPQATSPVIAPPPTSIQAPTTPTAETYTQCVYRCDTDRTTCITQNAQSATCQPEYNTCYTGCSSRLISGSGR